jgi:FkbM family methyltransferase
VANPLLSLAAAAARLFPAPLKRRLYRLGPLSAGLRSALNRAAPVGLGEVEVAGGALTGTRMILDMQKEKDYWLGTYEIDLQHAASDFVKPGMVAYDVGANIGYVSLILAKLVGTNGMVIAFEPLPENQDRFQKQLSLNQDAQIRLIPMAVGETSGKKEFLVHSSGGMGKISGATGRDTQYKDAIKVECTTLDDFIFKQRNPQPHIVKIDIEGGEGLALRGADKLISNIKPLFVIELHGKEAAFECWQILTGAGYSIHNLTWHYPEVTNVTLLDWKSYILARPKA